MEREAFLTLKSQMTILPVEIWDSGEKKKEKKIDLWLGWKLDATVGINLGWTNTEIPCHPSEDPETLLPPARRINLDKMINCPDGVTEMQNISQMRLLTTYTISTVIIILHAINSWLYTNHVYSWKRHWNPSRYSSIPTAMRVKRLLFLQTVSTEPMNLSEEPTVLGIGLI